MSINRGSCEAVERWQTRAAWAVIVFATGYFGGHLLWWWLR